LSPAHPDDFTLLRHVAGDLPEAEAEEVSRHVSRCDGCAALAREIAGLDGELAARAEERSPTPRDAARLAPEDPFRSRPPAREPSSWRGDPASLAARALEASERALPICERLLQASRNAGQLAEAVDGLALQDAAHRFGLLYALQESGRRIAEAPPRALQFAAEVLNRVRREPFRPEGEQGDAESFVPRLVLRGQAHLLAGQACNWTRELERARSHLELAYRCFARAGGDEVSLALVEHIESQRRSFLGRPRDALILARRALTTFESLGLEEHAARAQASCALALDGLNREPEAVESYVAALRVLERHGLWSNYVGVLNNMAALYARFGKLDEARRVYARALRRLSRERDRSFVAYIRHGLADVLFAAGFYREAAVSLAQASRLYRESGLLASALIASLFEVESWGRHGDLHRARRRLDLFLEAVAQQRVLDPSVAQEIGEALSGSRPDFQRVAELRRQTAEILSERFRPSPA